MNVVVDTQAEGRERRAGRADLLAGYINYAPDGRVIIFVPNRAADGAYIGGSDYARINKTGTVLSLWKHC